MNFWHRFFYIYQIQNQFAFIIRIFITTLMFSQENLHLALILPLFKSHYSNLITMLWAVKNKIINNFDTEFSVQVLYIIILHIINSRAIYIVLYDNYLMSRRGISESKGQVQRYQRSDPFSQMQQMMMGFGGMRNDPFFGAMMGFGSDPFNDIFKFSDVHKNMHSKGAEGSFVCQSFVSSSKMGPDGKVIRQDYFQNSMGQHRKGNTISQKQQAYKNSSGVNRIAEERMLNDRGRKIVRQKNGNNVEQTNHYYNIDQQEAGRFDSDWRNADKQMKFIQNHQKYLQQIGNQPRQMQLGYENYPREQNKRIKEDHRRQRNDNYEVQSRHSRQPQLQHKPASTVSGSRGSKRSQISKHSNATHNSRRY